ncbi:cytochrome P450 [Streptomyces sparsogenes]|uniref:cytochrome P450 family protein n=1 Tax=Streptomyces sparsogenes TaxID=67365 RepID=UPI0033305D3C
MTATQKSGEYQVIDPHLIADPYGGFGRIRETTPIARGRLWNDEPVWLVTRYEDVAAVLTDPRFANNSRSIPGNDTDYQVTQLTRLGIPKDLIPYRTEMMMHLDAPDHTRLRKLVARTFSMQRISRLQPRMTAVTEELVDALPQHIADDGTVDLIEHLALPLPLTIICELIGIPQQDKDLWYVSSDMDNAFRLPRMLQVTSEYVKEMIQKRRVEPTDDLLTALIQTHDDEGHQLTETELISMVFLLVYAGHEATSFFAGNCVHALLTHPEQLALLLDDMELMPGAIQELLRFGTPAFFAQQRYATADVTINDTRIRQGDLVLPILGVANRDPRKFQDPDRLDLRRQPDNNRGIQHAAFSLGPHYCLGAVLATQEIDVLLRTLFRRYPELSLGVPVEETAWRRVPGIRRLDRLPLRLGTPAA